MSDATMDRPFWAVCTHVLHLVPRGSILPRAINQRHAVYAGGVNVSYQRERDEFIARMTREGLNLDITRALLRAATTLHRLAELACSSEAADRDRIPCPASTTDLRGRARKPSGPCICDRPDDGHEDIPRIRLQDWRTEQNLARKMPRDWAILTAGDPRGYVLRVIPPSYAERNKDRDRFNLDSIGVPNGPSGLRF